MDNIVDRKSPFGGRTKPRQVLVRRSCLPGYRAATRLAQCIFLILLIHSVGCSGWPKHISAVSFSSEASQYLPKDMALEQVSFYFDVNPDGVLLTGYNIPHFFEISRKEKRFPFEQTRLTIRAFGRDVENINHATLIIRKEDWSAFALVPSSRIDKSKNYYQEIKRVVTALKSLGVNIE